MDRNGREESLGAHWGRSMSRPSHSEELTKLAVEVAMDWVWPEKPKGRAPTRKAPQPPAPKPMDPQVRWVANALAGLAIIAIFVVFGK